MISKKTKITSGIVFILFVAAYPIYIYHSKIWGVIDKIGALATGLALFAAMYQSYVAWRSANSSSEANAQNFFQQKFNLILEQHNSALEMVKKWSKDSGVNGMDIRTDTVIQYIRGHEILSTYMRILYHTLKSIREEMPVKSDENEQARIIKHKRYTSLVRSFIPNDILFFIACNSAIYDERHFHLPGSIQYKFYNTMLKDYDFFEHLIIKNSDPCQLKKIITDISYLTYDACLSHYTRRAGLINIAHDEYGHINEFNNLLLDSKFYICLSYELKGKYINMPGYIKDKISISKLIMLYLDEGLKNITSEGLVYYFNEKINSEVESSLRNILSNENYIWNMDLTQGNYGFFDFNKVYNILFSGLSFHNSHNDLVTFRDNFYGTMFKTIEKTSIQFASRPGYIENLRRNAMVIHNQCTLLLDKLIIIKQDESFHISNREILKTKKNDLKKHIQKLMRN